MAGGARRVFCPAGLMAFVAAFACSITFAAARPLTASAASAQSRALGEAAIESYLPSQRISIAIVTTFRPTAYDAQGNPSAYWQVIWAKIGKVLAPRDAPVLPPGLS